MKLSKNFSLQEMTKSQTALRRGIDNTPTPDKIEPLIMLCENVLQPVRDHFDRPVTITSGYRSPELCMAIGSKPTSQHTKGQAADFEVPGVSNMEVAKWVAENCEFDQLILECYTGGNTGWIHCSYVHEPRKELLTYDRENGYRKGLLDG
jgi:zinc D-Ala-D-Ala carboxypeptidase